MKRIALLTSGGDAPGMNAAIRAAVRVGIARGLEVLGVQWGYRGLISGDLDRMDNRSVAGIIQQGGTMLGTSRSREFMSEAGQLKAMEVLAKNKVDGLIVIGGEGSLRGALALHRRGVAVVGVPASIDNDLACTETAIGVDTALNTALEAVDKIKQTASSHNRAFIIEVMGRNSGYLALATAVASGAEAVLLPEVEIDPEVIFHEIDEAYQKHKTHFIIIAAEGSTLKAVQLKDYIDRKGARTYESRLTILGHVQRGGSPTAFDRLLATRFGAKAAGSLADGIAGKMVVWDCGRISLADIDKIESPRRPIDNYLYELAEMLDR